MREYSSINVSAYEAPNLAERLNERSQEGWDVVSIVSTGSTITAYLSRPLANAETTEDSNDMVASSAGAVILTAIDAVHDGVESDDVESDETNTDATGPSDDIAADADTDTESDAGSDSSADPVASAENSDADNTPVGTIIGTDETDQPTTEQPTQPNFIGSTATDSSTSDNGATDAGWGQSSSADDAAAGHVATAASTQATDQATTGAAPAGWYADPAGRFELRYWDGGQWTEHVARGGAQFTDPPVA